MKPKEQATLPEEELPELCRACTARHGGVCAALSPSQLFELMRTTSKRTVPVGTELTALGEEERTFSNVLAGVVKLSKLLPDGRQQIVGLQFAPDFVGRPFKRESDVTAEAVTEVTLCSFPKRTLEKMVAETPALEHRLYQQALAELDEARELLMTLGRKTAQERVASFLLMIARHAPREASDHGDAAAGPARPLTFELPLTRAEMADFLGLTIETVSRQLTRLKLADLIRIDKSKYFTIPDPDALVAASGE